MRLLAAIWGGRTIGGGGGIGGRCGHHGRYFCENWWFWSSKSFENQEKRGSLWNRVYGTRVPNWKIRPPIVILLWYDTRVPFLRTTHAMNSAGSTNIPVHPYLAGKITPNPSTKSRRRRLGKKSTQVQNFRSQLAVVSARRRSKI